MNNIESNPYATANYAINTQTQNQRITNILLLNASFIDNLGLMHGKMGIAIYFFHLARETQNQIYEDYAGELIDEIYEEITLETSLDFENGLAGIGWGIEYLVQNGFIEADTDEVLEEFDNKLFKQLVYSTPQNIGLLNGLTGLGAYFLKRVQNPQANDESIQTLTNKQTLIHLIDQLDRRTQDIGAIIHEPESELQVTGFKFQVEPETSNLKPVASNLKPETKPTFDLLWDYPVLLWFLAELHAQNIFNFKVETIIQRLIEPLSEELNYPQQHSNRLLLALALQKLKNGKMGKWENGQTEKLTNEGMEEWKDAPTQTIWNNLKQPETTCNNPEQSETPNLKPLTSNLKPETFPNYFNQSETNRNNTETILEQLISGISRETLLAELPENNATLRNGSSGIAWIYQQLYKLNAKEEYLHEAQYWNNHAYKNNVPDNGFAGFIFENETNAFGILEGLAGIGLLHKTLLQFDHLSI